MTLVLMQLVPLLHSNCWQAAAADAAVEVRAANARAERLEQELQLVRCVRHLLLQLYMPVHSINVHRGHRGAAGQSLLKHMLLFALATAIREARV
jgi:hypothetical protein